MPCLWVKFDKLSVRYGRIQIDGKNSISYISTHFRFENLKFQNTIIVITYWIHIEMLLCRLVSFNDWSYRITVVICVHTPYYSIEAVGYLICFDPLVIIEPTLCLYRLYFKRRVKFDSYPLVCVLSCCCPTSPRCILWIYTNCINVILIANVKYIGPWYFCLKYTC